MPRGSRAVAEFANCWAPSPELRGAAVGKNGPSRVLGGPAQTRAEKTGDLSRRVAERGPKAWSLVRSFGRTRENAGKLWWFYVRRTARWWTSGKNAGKLSPPARPVRAKLSLPARELPARAPEGLER